VKDIDGQSPLHRAARAVNVQAMEALAAAGADMNLADRMGMTPLHFAARTNDPRIASALIRHGAKVDVVDKFGCTPMHDATHARNENVIALLVGAGAKPEVANAYGVTPLQLADRIGRPALAGIMKGTASPTVASTAELASDKQGPDEPIQGAAAKKVSAAPAGIKLSAPSPRYPGEAETGARGVILRSTSRRALLPIDRFSCGHRSPSPRPLPGVPGRGVSAVTSPSTFR
jgi:hypothetical protein